MIKIDLKNEWYRILFLDNGGVSILAKTKSVEVAKRKALKFGNYLKEKRLLKPEKSIWK